jgi:tRNA A37 threonylcarbamoyladenosine modification protein TsaB
MNASMGWLGIDTRVNGHSVISWVEGEQIESIQVEGKAARALLVAARLLEDRLACLEGVLVASGPGTFSSIRTGVLYANLIARLKGIPLLEVSEAETALSFYPKVIHEYAQGTRQGQGYVAPIYDREPNITTPRLIHA